MALIFVDGFDNWTTFPGFWTSYDDSVLGNSLTLTDGVVSFLTTGGSGACWMKWAFPGSPQTVIVNMRVAFDANLVFADAPLFYLYDGNTVQCTVGTNSAGQFWVKRGSHSGTQIENVSTVAVTMDSVTFYDVEVKLTVANAGTAEVRLNGDTVLSVSGDLASTANELATNIVLGRTGERTGFNVEHVIIMDTAGTTMNDFIGPVKVSDLEITADGTHTTWTANTGARWDAINDADADGDTTYIEANTVSDKYSAVVSDLPATITTVHALAVWSHSKRDDDVSRAYKALLRSSGADQLSSEDNYAGPGYSYFINAFNQSPFTASAWTPAEVNGLEVGAQLTV